MKKSDRVLSFLKGGRKLTSLQAIQMFGDTRLAATVHSLKGKGHDIRSEIIIVTDRYGKNCQVAEYSMPIKSFGSLL